MEGRTRRVLVAWWLVGASAAWPLGACAARDGGGASAGGGQATEDVRPVSPLLAELPPAARLAIERQTVGATLRRVDTDEFLGREVYTAEFVTADGRPGEVQVTRDGRVLSRSVELNEMAFADVPEAVKATTLARTGGLTPRRVRVDDRMSRAVYVVSLVVAGRPTVFEIDETGAVLRETIDIERAQLPPVVEASIWRRFRQMPVTRVREVHEGASTTFVVDGTFERRRVRAEFEPTGRVRAVRAR